MTTPIAIALPLVPGQLEAWGAFVTELQGPRRPEYDASLARRGVTREQVFHQPTPQGDIVILVIEAADPARAMAALADPQHPFDRWFADQVRAFHGIAPEVLPQIRPGELVAAWTAPAVNA